MKNSLKNYENVIVNKPWGYEYLVYSNKYIGLWFLHIKKNQQTSFHCHPKKDTGLIVLNGIIDVSFFNDITRLSAGRKLMIRKGLFHMTKALSKGGASIFEIETPKLKHDLVRLEDKYGRKAKPYEGKSSVVKKTSQCFYFKNPKKNTKDTHIFLNCKIYVESITQKKNFMDIDDYENLIFLDGGIMVPQSNMLVISPGNVVIASVVKRLLSTFDIVHPKTVIMIISKK